VVRQLCIPGDRGNCIKKLFRRVMATAQIMRLIQNIIYALLRGFFGLLIIVIAVVSVLISHILILLIYPFPAKNRS